MPDRLGEWRKLVTIASLYEMKNLSTPPTPPNKWWESVCNECGLDPTQKMCARVRKTPKRERPKGGSEG